MIHANLNQVTENIKSQMQISLLEVGAGSFDIRLASTKTVDLLSHSDFGDAVEEFLKLLKAGSDENQLKELLGRLRLRVAENYTEFLEFLSESVVDTRFTWTSPNPERGWNSIPVRNPNARNN